MTVEDGVLLLLAAQVSRGLFTTHDKDVWASAFVRNVAAHVNDGKALSTEQSRLILKLLARVRSDLISGGVEAEHLDYLLSFPSHRQTPYPSANVPREVRYLGDNFFGFRFKRNDAISADLKAMVRDQDFGFEDIWFHPQHRLWVVPVNRDTLPEIMQVIARHGFGYDDEVAGYLAAAHGAQGQRSDVSTDRDLGLIAVQVCDNEMVSWIVRDVLRGEPV